MGEVKDGVKITAFYIPTDNHLWPDFWIKFWEDMFCPSQSFHEQRYKEIIYSTILGKSTLVSLITKTYTLPIKLRDMMCF